MEEITTLKRYKMIKELFQNGKTSIGTEKEQIDTLIQHSLVTSRILILIDDFIADHELTEELEEYINENW